MKMYKNPTDNFSYYESIYGERRPILGEHSANCGYRSTEMATGPLITSQPGTSNGRIGGLSNGLGPYPTASGTPGYGYAGYQRSLPRGVQPHRNPFAVPRPPIEQRDEDSAEGVNCSPCCDNDNVRRTFRGICLGQILSLCLCGTGVSSQLLSNRGVNAPAAQAFTNYFLLCFVFCTALSCKDGDEGLLSILRKRGWKYFILALIDVEANYMVVYAYQFTTLTSVQLLDCSTIPIVLLLSWLFLSVRYLISHVIGVCICLIGIACLIWADILDGKSNIGGSDKVLGDLLCLGAAFLYSVSNVSQEFLVKQYTRIEYLGMVGLFGTLISGIQTAILEHKALSRIDWNAGTIGCFLLFAFSMFIFYAMVTVVLQRTSALMMNLSTLSADFYSLLFGLFLFKDTFHYLYFVSFIVVICGSIVYSLKKTQVRDADEPRRVCPCLFMFCCCCECCFEEGDSTQGSINVTPSPSAQPMVIMSQQQQPCPVHGHNRIPSTH